MVKPTSREWWALGGIACLFLLLKLAYHPDLRLAIDASYYFNVARHVSRGEGLLTTLSLYRQGFHELPHVSHIYPLWPLVLGAVGAAIGLFRAAHLLPEVLFFADLLLLFLLTRAVARVVLTRRRSAPDRFVSPGSIALLVVLLTGGNHVFFRASSLPYTEALAVGLSLSALLAVCRFSLEPRLRWALAAGGLAAAAYLTRSQCAGVLLGVLGALALVGIRSSAARRGLIATAALAILVIAPWFGYLGLTSEAFSLRSVLDFAAYRETPELGEFVVLVSTSSIFEWVIDRASGFLVAFAPRSPYSYVWSWGAIAYVVPVALALVVFRIAFQRWHLRSVWRASTELSALPVVATLAAGALTLAPVHLLHSVYGYEWYFGERYGVFLVLLIAPALAYALGSGRTVRLLSIVLLGLSVLHAGRYIRAHMQLDSPDPHPVLLELESWLATQPVDHVFLTRDPQPLAIGSEAGFHWVQCSDSPTVTRNMLTYLPIDFVILFPNDRACPFARDLGDLETVTEFGGGEDVIAILRADITARDRSPDPD